MYLIIPWLGCRKQMKGTKLLGVPYLKEQFLDMKYHPKTDTNLQSILAGCD